LDDMPVQYREVQGCETKQFLHLFPKMTVLDGGIDSGFTRVEPKDYKPRLMHIVGRKRAVQVLQVPLEHESLNDSDCFVLDAGLHLFQFHGTKSTGWERRKANAVVCVYSVLASDLWHISVVSY